MAVALENDKKCYIFAAEKWQADGCMPDPFT
jgi:hypothetical protein